MFFTNLPRSVKHQRHTYKRSVIRIVYVGAWWERKPIHSSPVCHVRCREGLQGFAASLLARPIQRYDHREPLSAEHLNLGLKTRRHCHPIQPRCSRLPNFVFAPTMSGPLWFSTLELMSGLLTKHDACSYASKGSTLTVSVRQQRHNSAGLTRR
ncbi:hypothetical protein BC835DRAFT_191348 [Cytidiella melzeri]|nr:hypothetical protein BC835DRAFT_191348 [Cytidiella melzeri]